MYSRYQFEHQRSGHVAACGPAFTLIELLIVIGIISVLLGILLPVLSSARESGRAAACLARERQIGTAARMYMDDNDGQMFHHHEGWVLDDGTQVDELPTTLAGCEGGGMGNSQAEKPWVIFFQPYLTNNRQVGFCPSDASEKSRQLATDLTGYNGGITTTDQDPPPNSEQAIAEDGHLTMESYLLNSVYTHKSARYAVEGTLFGFATDSNIAKIKNQDIIMFSERNSEALNAPDNAEYGSVSQDDYDSWVGEAALVRWGSGQYGEGGWIKYNRHRSAANYIYNDGHAVTQRWSSARIDQYPDRRVRNPLADPPR